MRALLLFFILIFTHSSAQADGETLMANAVNTLMNLGTKIKCSTVNKGSCECNDFAEQQKVKEWSDAGFKNAEITTSELFLLDEPYSYSHDLELSFVVFRDAGWNQFEIAAAYESVARIYARCGIRLRKINVVMTDAPNKQTVIDKKVDGISYQIAKKTPPIKKPIVYFAKSAIDKNLAFMFKETGDNENNPLYNTAWVTKDAQTHYKKIARNPTALAIAHELGHAMAPNSDHVSGTQKNLMSENANYLNESLTPNQCKEFKRNPALTKL